MPKWLQDSCTFETGDGAGVKDELIGTTYTDDQCAAAVMKEKPHANGATWGPPAGELPRNCYAEFGQTTVGITADCPLCRNCDFKRMLMYLAYNNTFYYNIYVKTTIIIFNMFLSCAF